MKYTSGLETMREINHRVPEIEIRSEQIEALDAIQLSEEAGNYASLAVLPPGIGKTVIMAADTRRRLSHKPDARSLFLCNNNEILTQARNTYQKIVGPDFTYGMFSGDGRDYDELSVLFGSFQVMADWRQAFLEREFNFGTVDEAHHSKAPTFEPTLDYFEFEHLIGVTATPDRLDVHDIRDIYGEPVYELTLEAAIAQGKLAAVDYYVITDEIADTGTVIDDVGEKYTMGEFNKTIFAPHREKEIVAIAEQYGEKIDGPVKRLGFCTSIEEAARYALEFPNAAAIHSRMSREQQRQLIKKYRNGEIDTLLTVSMFNEGVDIPDANQILFLHKTGSKNIYFQQLGRGLRKTLTKKRVQVLDFVNNAEHLLLVDRMWRDIKSASKPSDIKDLYEISLSNVTFDERSEKALTMLRNINAQVSRPDQDVPSGSTRASSLARDLGVTPATLMAIAGSLKIEYQVFPTQRGSKVFYFLPEQTQAIKAATEQLL